MARHRAPRRRGWQPVLAAPTAPSLPVPGPPVPGLPVLGSPERGGPEPGRPLTSPSGTGRLAAQPSTGGRVAASGVLAVAALGAVAAVDQLDAVRDTGGDAESRVATVSDRAPATTPPGAALAEPVAPEPPVFELDSLLKGVAAAERAARARSAQAQPPAAECAAGRSGFGAVKAWVVSAGEELRCRFGVGTVYGVGSRAGTSDHPSGLALDFMVNRATGDQLADYALRNRARLGISYVIYRQRINFGSGWQAMEDRGGATANHMDHVHVSFQRRPASAPSRA